MRIPLHRSSCTLLVVAALSVAPAVEAQDAPPPERDLRIFDIAGAASAERVESDIRTLAGFGTRNTMSDTLSETRGIGAARRWIKAEFDRISADCGGCMEVFYQEEVFEGGRIGDPTNVVNVVLAWDAVEHPGLAGYKIYWRATTAPQWEHSRFVGDVTEYTPSRTW